MPGCRTLRLVQEQDIPAILEIYRPYVQETNISFEYEVPSLEEFSQRVRSIAADYPYLICEEAGTILAYAYAHRQMERAAYQWNAELSVYVDRAHRRQGLGRALYQALMELLPLQNVRTVYGIVTSPNPGSEGLHQSFGFHQAGLHHNTGYKGGTWLDTIWFEKQIGDYDPSPAPLRSIREVDSAAMEAVLRRCSEAL